VRYHGRLKFFKVLLSFVGPSFDRDYAFLVTMLLTYTLGLLALIASLAQAVPAAAAKRQVSTISEYVRIETRRQLPC
jgi:hypothetical protein